MFNFDLVQGMAGGGIGRIERPASGGAAAIWMPFEWLGPTPLAQELRALPTLLFTTGLARFGRLAAMRDDMDKHHPLDRRHAYLWFLGVTPAAQGHGVGSRLLKHRHRPPGRRGPARLPGDADRTQRRPLPPPRLRSDLRTPRARPDAPMMWSMWRDVHAPEA